MSNTKTSPSKIDDTTQMVVILEKNVQYLGFGEISGTVVLKNGEPIIDTLNLVLKTRKKYQLDKKR